MHSTGLHTTYIMAGDVTNIAVLGEVPTISLLVFSFERGCHRTG